MQFMGVKISAKEIIITSIFGGTIFFLAKNSLKQVAPEVAKSIDPLNSGNIFNEYFEKVYKFVTGSEQGPGADIYDLTHDDNPSNIPEVPPAESTYDLDFGLEDDGLIYKYKTKDTDYDLDYGGPGAWF